MRESARRNATVASSSVIAAGSAVATGFPPIALGGCLSGYRRQVQRGAATGRPASGALPRRRGHAASSSHAENSGANAAVPAAALLADAASILLRRDSSFQ